MSRIFCPINRTQGRCPGYIRASLPFPDGSPFKQHFFIAHEPSFKHLKEEPQKDTRQNIRFPLLFIGNTLSNAAIGHPHAISRKIGDPSPRKSQGSALELPKREKHLSRADPVAIVVATISFMS